MSRGRMANCISTTDSCMRSGFGSFRNTSRLGPASDVAACCEISSNLGGYEVGVFRQANANADRHALHGFERAASQGRVPSPERRAACRPTRIRTRHRFRPARIEANARWPAVSAFAPRGRSGRARSRSSRMRPRAAANEGTVRRNETISCAGSARTTTSSALKTPSVSSCAIRASICRRRRDSSREGLFDVVAAQQQHDCATPPCRPWSAGFRAPARARIPVP